jgi:NAD(P)-dependent dehydrogenase (short-subunit alcohol dehydrogenase family)
MTQRVLITAGAGGIGLAIAKAFVANGARVHIADVNAEAVQQITQSNPGITGPDGHFHGDAVGHSVAQGIGRGLYPGDVFAGRALWLRQPGGVFHHQVGPGGLYQNLVARAGAAGHYRQQHSPRRRGRAAHSIGF